MAEKDYYRILGVEKNASQEDIKRAYKNLAKKFHPDVSKENNAEEKFKEVQEAFTVLGDNEKKQQYDQYGTGFEGFKGFSGFGPGFGGFDFRSGDFGFEDIFSNLDEIFGGAFTGAKRKSRSPRRGFDLEYQINLAFEDAVFGAEKEISINRIEKCSECSGSGSKDSKKETCRTCSGRGVIQNIKRTMFGVFSTQTTCSKCRGEGAITSNPCSECKGEGRKKVKAKIKVKIPEGIDSGNTIRLSGQGNAGDTGAEPGDLFITVNAEQSEIFKRDGTDVYSEIPLTFSEAAIGTEIELPTLRGKGTLKIPEGTQTETIFKLKNQGIKDLRFNSYGDHFVKAVLQTPKDLSRHQKELFEELAKFDATKEKRNNFFDKIKKKFKR